MGQTFTNKHGRQFTRGVRPFLLLPKVLCVAAYFGGLIAMLLVDRPMRLHELLVLPAGGGAVVFGALLLLAHRSVLIRMRWLQVKLLLVAVGLIGGHVWYAAGGSIAANTVLLVNATLLIVLGRHKPRLGQDIATVYQQRVRRGQRG